MVCSRRKLRQCLTLRLNFGLSLGRAIDNQNGDLLQKRHSSYRVLIASLFLFCQNFRSGTRPCLISQAANSPPDSGCQAGEHGGREDQKMTVSPFVRVSGIWANNGQSNTPSQSNDQTTSASGGGWWSGGRANNGAWQNTDNQQSGNATNNLEIENARPPRRPADGIRQASGAVRVNNVNALNVQQNAPSQSSWQSASTGGGGWGPWFGWGGGGSASNTVDQVSTSNQEGNATNNINLNNWPDVKVGNINATNAQSNSGSQSNAQSASAGPGTASNSAWQSQSNNQTGEAVNNINIWV